MPVIDFHNHYYPPRYMKALQSGESSVRVTVDSDGNPNLHYPGDYNVAVRGHRDLAYREEVLDKHGVTMQVVTLTTPGTHVEEPATAVRLASDPPEVSTPAVCSGIPHQPRSQSMTVRSPVVGPDPPVHDPVNALTPAAAASASAPT